MATAHYSLPTINGSDTIDGVNAINGLANAVDSAIYQVAGQIAPDYDLPVATATSLGGVRGGGGIEVTAGTGDMNIKSGSISNGMLGASCVGGSNLQTNSVAASHLTSDVVNQLTAGYQASLKLDAAPVRYTRTTTVANAYCVYVVNEAAKMVTMKLMMGGAVINVTGTGSTTPDTAVVTFQAIPTQYRPVTDFSQMMGLSTSISGEVGVLMWYGCVRDDGVPCIYYTNSWAAAGQYTVSGDCTLSWFYGVQQGS